MLSVFSVSDSVRDHPTVVEAFRGFDVLKPFSLDVWLLASFEAYWPSTILRVWTLFCYSTHVCKRKIFLFSAAPSL